MYVYTQGVYIFENWNLKKITEPSGCKFIFLQNRSDQNDWKKR